VARTLRLTLALVLMVLAGAACGDDEGGEPLPTRASFEMFDQPAPATPAVPEPSPIPATTAPPSASPTVIAQAPTATAIPATGTPTPLPSATPSTTQTATPTAIPPDVLTATATAQVALTNTAVMESLFITQTAAAAEQRTQIAGTAGALVVTLTPTPEAPQYTPVVEITAAPTFTPTPGQPYAIAFYSDRYGSDDLFLMTAGGQQRLLLGTAANEREPSCAPDGTSLVYASDASGSYQLYRLDLASGQSTQLTDSAGLNFAPVFSPDGGAIAFVSTRSGGIPAIWLMDATGGNPRQVSLGVGRATSPAWGPDGAQLLFATNQRGVWDIVTTFIGDEVELPLPPDFSAGNQVWPAFDPLGERIAYTLWPDLTDPQTADIFLIDFEQPAPRAVRVGAGADIAWAWYDEARLLASVGGPGDIQLALVDAASGDTQFLTDAGPFNGGARPCSVDPGLLPPEPTPIPSPTPPPTATATPTPSITPLPSDTPPPTPTFTPSPTPTATATSRFTLVSQQVPPTLRAWQGQRHVIQPGDTLNVVSQRYGVPVARLSELNLLTDPNLLEVGEVLVIPVTRIGHRQSGYQLPNSDRTGELAVRKKIVVNITTQRVYAYENGRVVRVIDASTGQPHTPTVEGDFKIYYKLTIQDMSGPGYYVEDVPWVMYFYGDYSLHGVYWHNNFGTPVSHGCVNLPTPEAKWLFEWAELGTPVTVHEATVKNEGGALSLP
jgi:Tol biopolymer transport system component/LysM repeat protein